MCVTVPTLVEMLKDIESPYEVSLPPYLHYTSIRMARVVSVLDSGAEGPGFKLQSRRCRVTVLGKLFTLFTLTANNRDQLRNPMLSSPVWSTFTFYHVKTLRSVIDYGLAVPFYLTILVHYR